MATTHDQELQQLREEARQLRQRLEELENRLQALTPVAPPVLREGEPPGEPQPVARQEPRPPEPVAPPVMAVPPVIIAPPIVPQPVAPPVEKESFEVRLGTYWLPRLGMVLLLTGMVFFAAYYAPRLSVLLKVAVAYLVCAVLGGVGMWLEKRTTALARVLQAGALALTYFVTYAAHYVEQFRVIESSRLALALLSVVVVAIVIVAQKRRSPTLAGLALFFGYYTSLVGGVATFTLAANAFLALAAMYFLARNRWVPISYGAVFATYLTYAIWAWKVSNWSELEHLIFGSGYLTGEQFGLRAAFLTLYWALFAVGGLMVNREAMAPAERSGLATLNNAFFFLLFSLLMHHAHPAAQWQFQFLFASALLLASASAYQRFRPDRTGLDTYFIQGLAVATLGVVSYFKGAQLVAVLALESVFLVWLSRQVQSRWVAWIARAAFVIAALAAWNKRADWNESMIVSAWFAAVAGLLCARLESRREPVKAEPVLASFAFGLLATALAMSAAGERFAPLFLPWAWLGGAVLVALIGAGLRTREIVWAAHLPLIWAYLKFLGARVHVVWPLDQSLALVAVTLAFGVVAWGRQRARELPALATQGLWPYALLATLAMVLTTHEHCDGPWRLTAYAAETVLLVGAATLAKERAFTWNGLIVMAAGVFGYLTAGRGIFGDRTTAWGNLLLGLLLFALAERVVARQQRQLSAWMIALLTAVAIVGLGRLVERPFLTVSWAGLGCVLLALGFAVRHRPYRLTGLVALGLSLLRLVFYDLGRLGTPQRILSFIGLGVILLLLAYLYAKTREKLAKWL
jgi:uncharacterized membrane protein